MECNKDEALRAKEIAERKFNSKDYLSAKKFVMKAQNLYPGLEGLPQMLTTLEVYISAQNKISNGEVDWYNVLGVSSLADDDTVRKQYRKLALALHPDKNKSLGADGAFKLVSEAWSLLSDKDKRVAYNKKLNPTAFYHRDPKNQSKVPSSQPSANGIHTSTNSSTKTQGRHSSTPSPSLKKQNTFAGTAADISSQKKPDTFWTICNQCKTQYEYLRIYLNHTLLCPNCQQAFLAEERAPPPNINKPPPNQSHRQKHHQNSKHNIAASNNIAASSGGRSYGTAQRSGGESFGVGSYVNGSRGTFTPPSTASQTVAPTANNIQFDRNHMHKRGAGATPPADDPLLKKRRVDDTYNMVFSDKGKAATGDVFEGKKVSVEAEKTYRFTDFPGFSTVRRELNPLELRNMLARKARSTISKVLEQWNSREEKVISNSKKQKSNGTNFVNNIHENDHPRSIPSNSEKQGKDSVHDREVSPDKDNEVTSLQPVSITVPDSDFHNFDLDRTETSFGDDQVWAAYDENDGMPRYYARIIQMISENPFKLKISWLNSRTNSEFGSLQWVGSGFLKTCGDFRTGKHEINEALNAFSHRVRFTKGARGVIRILPSKGEIWALYRNWSPEWNQDTPEEVMHKYDMVEVVDDYDEEQGISVVPLVKVDGFKLVFAKPADSSEVGRRIPREEMFRFSHQVPHHLLTGEEAENSPKGCYELDPAAIPLELLTTEAQKAETTTGEIDGSKESAEGTRVGS
ncbi:unnamed protein product [Linum trigynum]|uniref:J domain-containing protein n=1 Tax=Linum trigynum TaxID=586398 RepID=A0AAV2EYE2_9ROSI